MTDRAARCYVRLPGRSLSGDYDPVELFDLPYATADEDGNIQEAGRADIGALPDARETILIADARDVLLITLPVPSVNGDRLRGLLPGLIEDHLLVDPQRAHVAVLRRHLDGHAALAVVDRNWITFVLEAFGNKRHTRFLPAQLCIPASDAHPTVVVESWGPVNGTVLLTVRTGLYAGYGILLAAAHSTQWIQERLSNAEVLIKDPLPAGWDKWIAGSTSVADCDLCQFELSHSRRSASGQNTIHRWRWPASFGAVALLLCILGINLQWLTLVRQQSEMRNQMTQKIREHFPKSGPIIDAPLQMRQQVAALAHLKGQPVPGDLDDMSNRLAAALGPIPPEAVIELQYRHNTMEIQLAEDSKVDSIAFQQRLKAAGIAAQQKDGRWHMELRT